MRILFVDPYDNNILNFRKELLDRLICDGHELILATNYSKKIESLYSNNVVFFWTNCDLRNKSIINNLKLISSYKKIIKTSKPDLILSFTIKPNIYCSMFAKNIPIIANITGLGMSFSKKGLLSSLIKKLYRIGFKNTDYILFQNTSGYKEFVKNNIPIKKYQIIPGSGVNLDKFAFSELAISNKKRVFLYASRFIKEKGIECLLNAVPAILENDLNAEFVFVGNGEAKYVDCIKSLMKTWPQNVFLHLWTDDMYGFYKKATFVVAPSFYKEGISNVLLEALATGRPIITTNNNPGCMELLNEENNGYGVLSNDLNSLIVSLKRACSETNENITKMGINGRNFVENNYDRNITVNCYLSIIRTM